MGYSDELKHHDARNDLLLVTYVEAILIVTVRRGCPIATDDVGGRGPRDERLRSELHLNRVK